MSKKNRETTAPVTETPETVAPVTQPVQAGNATNPNSIRQRVCTALISGQDTKQITEMLKADFPNSQAAAKPGKHIGWYRSTLRKAGKLPKRGETVPTQS